MYKEDIIQVIMCEQQVKVYKEKEKKTFANMFDKFAAKDQKRNTNISQNKFSVFAPVKILVKQSAK